MKRFVAGLCGVALAVGLSGGAARAERVTQAGEVLVVLNEQFLNSLLEAVASQPEPPSFPLAKGDGGAKCPSAVTLAAEAEGRRTAVRFIDGRITAPVAFRGSYEAPLVGCLYFEGWADTAFDLSFDPAAQALKARIAVRDVKLRNIPSALSGGIQGLVQDAVDERVNPVEILRAEQLGARVPTARGDGLRLRAREVRHEVAGQELRLRIFYELVQPE
ncbi:MAG TPA: hypothetical protein VG148_17445 [Pyrinomonadaceae bacterium]|nr:hypothetical protein [Pyrinomonadaceae bacterium]